MKTNGLLVLTCLVVPAWKSLLLGRAANFPKKSLLQIWRLCAKFVTSLFLGKRTVCLSWLVLSCLLDLHHWVLLSLPSLACLAFSCLPSRHLKANPCDKSHCQVQNSGQTTCWDIRFSTQADLDLSVLLCFAMHTWPALLMSCLPGPHLKANPMLQISRSGVKFVTGLLLGQAATFLKKGLLQIWRLSAKFVTSLFLGISSKKACYKFGDWAPNL